MLDDVFAQDDYRLRLEWAAEGIDALAPRCAVLVVVDVLSFTTSVDVALGRGGRVLPVPSRDEQALAAAKQRGAVLAGERSWTLRPASLLDLPAGTLLALPSPNGARLCARAQSTGATVLAACLRNAAAVAGFAHHAAAGAPIGLVPAGERWGVTAGPLRPGVEDLLGAGAVAAALLELDPAGASPEVRLAARTFLSARADLPDLLAACSSGRELAAAGHGADVDLASMLGCSAAVPVLREGVFQDEGVG
ncbi:2-phosphosulfolactate phosphatase [Kutzneria viridogrisea]|uniref:Probable 2-phosphosulfolactate phosphatase n=1 Tax=Kutzneria viridogrisea TaxID=47990 RepID=A0ABR6BLJ6_9PSEU|nr:2-phosphosulfolactate phosphatase [Kutzneria albida]MBA8927758.1 2-phosphosulfolactate phosphatase [Kutzneria viridogrisea]